MNQKSRFDTTPIARELADLARRRRVLQSGQLPLPEDTRVITVVNQKGGVGKTTSVVNLAAAFAQAGAKVLVLDLDPQGNASTALGIEHHAEVPSTYEVLIEGAPLEDVVQQSPEHERLLCVPSTIHLAGADLELATMDRREYVLRDAVQDYLMEHDDIHYLFIDCPPSLGLLTINAFTAASEVLIPIQSEYYALEGVSQLLDTIGRIQQHLNPTLDLATVLLTMYDGRTILSKQVAEEVRGHFGDKTLETVIPRSVRVSEAPGFGQTVVTYDPNSPGALSYREAAKEIALRGAQK
ncbi:ParA family protein [Agrococcus casei]|uniref:Chromosome (Plasmid) partitioning protein ParA n=1 Tax=Agrococcus casei LMG 22410 TaxID=1255656 RepID=A0A1R4ER47_9MICO|nr:ParA family protein [Agrococcus casei]SJM46016.1 Chromosome (plasmid) partitioning protein ParA [Agrococcus casei LMG 22410]